MLNKVVLIGRLTKDPDVRTLDSGSTVATFTLAVGRTFKDRNGERGTDFIPIVAWSKTAELCGEYLKKGNQTAISGRIQTRTYEDNEGTKRYVTEVVADEVTFLSSKNENQQQTNERQTDSAVTDEDINQMYFTEDTDDIPF